MKNQVFVPTVAEFPEDIATSLEIQKPLVDAGYSPGLMLVIRGGIGGVTLDSIVEKQYANLEKVAGQYKNSHIITMLSVLPFEGLDFLHNPFDATEHVKKGVDFTRNLPIGSRKLLTFHSASVVGPNEFQSKSKNEWESKFNKVVSPRLKEIATYARDKGVEAKIETAAIPFAGDLPDVYDEYNGIRFIDLRSPFYFTAHWGFNLIYKSGLGICLDLCHNETVYKAAKKGDPDCFLHKEDKVALGNKTVFNDLMALKQTDLVHLNDGKGLYSPSVEGSCHKEGLALGEGDIDDLDKMITYMNERKIPFVFEINETDFDNRPNTKKSIEYFLNI